MKQENSKKSKAWLWLVLALVALLAVAGVVLALLLPGQQTGGNTDAVDAELYWNIDGAHYLEISEVPGFSAREAAEDGNYYITFAYKGQQVEKRIIDKQLVNFIDNMTAVGLVFDADGVVVDAVSPETVATEKAKDFYVQKVEGSTVTLNSSRALNGMNLELELTDSVGIYDVTDKAEFAGAVGQLEIMDRVLVYSDLADENVTHIYILEHPVEAGIYWRVERLYDTEKKVTTRVPDENGVYTIQFAHEGELVELKCKDQLLVTDMDSRGPLSGQFAFLFDEDGYIVEMTDIAMALRGKQLAADYHITAIDGDTYTATRISSGTEQGRVITFKLAQECDIFQVCQFGCYDDHCGEHTDRLQLLDRVNIYGNVDGEAVLIFVTRRIVDDQFYYNYNRQYGGVDKGTNRTKQSDGYYHFELLLDGKLKTVRANKEFADQMDAITSGCMGLKLNGNVVERVYDAGCVTGGAELGAVVTMRSGPVLTLTSPYSGNSWNLMLSADCKIYNAMTGEYGKEIGGTSDLLVGDSVMTFRNHADEVCIVFVRSRAVEGAKVYYNLTRKWNNDKQETTREPNEEGYYEFLMACEGKQVTVKTKAKGMATFIDQQLAPLVGLKVNKSGVISNAYAVDAVVPNSGKACNYRYVENVTKSTFNTYYFPGNDLTKKTVDATTWTIAKDCKIYNVSTAYSQFRGEKSTLKNGDYIQAIRDYTTNEITQIFIMQRDPTYGVKSYKADCAHCGKNVTWQPYGGKDIPVADAHYFLCVDLGSSQRSVGVDKDKDNKVCDIVLDLKGYTLTSTSRAFLVYDSLTIMDTKGGGKLVGTTPNANGDATSGSCIMVGEEGKLNIMGGELTLSDKCTAYGQYGGVLYIGTNAQVTMSGGKICGGTATNMGGNVAILGGSFTMTGGVIENGTSPNGEAIRVNSGSFTMSGGTVDGSITKGAAATVELSGAPVIKGLGLTVTAGTKLDVSKLSKDASVAVNATGVFTDTLDNAESWLEIIKPGAEGDKIIVKNGALCYVVSGPPSFVLDQDGDGMAVCPVCGGEEVAWTPVAAGERLGAGMSGHYYIKENSTSPHSQFATTIAKDAVLCIHLNGKTLTTSGRIATVGSGGTINIMGEGKLIGSGSYTGEEQDVYTMATLVAHSGGSINLHGDVTVTTTAAGKPVAKTLGNSSSAVKLYGNATIVHMDGGEGIDIERGKLTVDKSWTGSALVKFPAALVDGIVPASNGASTGAFTGTLTLSEAGTPRLVAMRGGLALEGASGDALAFVLDPDGDGMAVCPVCGGEEVQWTAVTDTHLGANVTDGGHYYLANDFDSTSQFLTMTGNKTVCFHLNGKNLTYPSRMFVTGSTLNMMGDGTVTSTATTTEELGGLVAAYGSGVINLYGGTYKTTNPNGMPVVTVYGSATARVNVYDGATVESVGVQKGTLHLSGKADAGLISVLADGKLSVAGDWTGTAEVMFENALVDGVVPAANGASTGSFTGTLTLNAEGTPKLVALGGRLALEGTSGGDEPPVQQPTFVLDPDGDGKAVCPVCGGEEVTWTAVAAGERVGAGMSGHYYLAADSTNANNQYATTTARDAVLCIHMNGKNLTTSGRIATVGAGGTINIMGEGTVTGSGSYTGADQDAYTLATLVANSGGTINLYDKVTVTTTAAGKPVVKVLGNSSSSVKLYGGATIVPMTGGEGIDIERGKLTVDGSWTGSALVKFPAAPVDGVVPAANGASTGDFTGILTLNAEGNPQLVAKDGGLAVKDSSGGVEEPASPYHKNLVLDAEDKALCPVCNKTVQWTAVTNTHLGTDVTDGGHYYLANDFVSTTQFLTMTGNKTVCFHLNGKNLTYPSRMFVTGSTLNIMGTGTVTSTSTNAENLGALVAAYGNGIINLYGGTYKTTNSNSMPVVTVYSSITASVSVYDGVTIESVEVQKGTLHLSGKADVGQINVTADGKLSVAEDWTGTATVKFASELVSGAVPAANGISTGDFTGILTLDAEGKPQLVARNGGLALLIQDPVEAEIARAKAVIEAAGAMNFSNANNLPTTCPACGANNVTWTAVATNTRIGNAVEGHYYLPADVNCPAAWTQYVTVQENSTVCLHLNGKNLTYGGRIALTFTGSTLNIMGNGTVTSNGQCTNATYNTAALYVETADSTLNLYGGTYTATGSGQFVLQTKTAATAVVNIYDTTVLVDGSTTDPAAEAVADPTMMITAGTVNMYGGEVKNGTGTAGGNVRLSNGTAFNMYAGTITGGRGNYGGNVSMDVNTVFNMKGGTISGGTAANGGGNIFTKGTVTIDGGTLTGGTATGGSGGSVSVHGGTVNLISGSISGGQTTVNGAHGGNISLNGGSTLNMDGGSITGGIARYQAGNLHVSDSTVVMTGGEISGGTASTDEATVATNHNIWLYGTSTMTLTGGVVKGVDGTTSVGTAIYLYAGTTLNLGGTASVVRADGVRSGNIYVSAGAKLNVLNDWVGTASVKFATAYADGAEVAAADGQCGSLSGDVFTAGGSYEGMLLSEAADPRQIVGTDGKLTVNPDHSQDNVLKVLGIGNSYTIDSMHLLYEIYKAEKPEQQVQFGFLYYGGCSLAQHAQFIRNNEANYVYYKMDNETGRWVQTASSTVEEALRNEQWDIVTMQQSSANSGRPETYNADIQTIQNHVKETLGYAPEFLWNMTWAYAEGYSNSYYVDNGAFSQAVMYKAITDTVQAKILTDSSFSGVIPAGTAIQNARTYWDALLQSDAVDHQTYAISRPDGTHLTNLGRFIAAYTWYCTISGETVDTLALTEIPSYLRINWGVYSYTATDIAVITEAVRNAIRTPYAVTASTQH